MATNNPHTQGVADDNSRIVYRQDLDTQTPGRAVVTAVYTAGGLEETYTGVDRGTGDVTVFMPTQPQVAGKTFTSVTVDDYGRVVAGSFGIVTELADSGVVPGIYGSATAVGVYTVDVKGRITNAVNTPIAIPTSQITNLNAWTGSTAITTLGTITTGTWNAGTVTVPYGGTGKTSWTQYGVVYANTTTTLADVTPNQTTTKQFLSMTGTGSAGAAPVWSSLVYADITNLNTWVGSTAITTVGTITTGTWNGSVIDPVHGGTGQSVYAPGDILYANTTTTLARLADVAIGSVLLSGGVNAPPLYGKVGLTAHVTGILPAANGGTGTSTAPTAGQLLVGTTSGTYAPVTVSATAPISVMAGSGSFQITHTVSGVTAGAYGSATTIPVITVNSTGHITSVTATALSVAGISSLNQPVGQVVIGNGTGLTSFPGFLYDDTTSRMTVSGALIGPNPDRTGFGIGLSLSSGAWGFGQDSINTYMNGKTGGGLAFMVNNTIYGSLGPEGVWSFNNAGITTLGVSSKLTLGYRAGYAGMLVCNSAGEVTSTPVLNNQVAYDSGDTPGYLPVKLLAGAGITFTMVVSGTGKSMVVNSRTNSWRPIVYAVNSTYTVLDTDDTIVINSASSSSTSVVLPVPGTAYQGRLVTVQHVGATGATTTISSAGTISGLTPTITTAYAKLEFFCANSGSGFIWVCR